MKVLARISETQQPGIYHWQCRQIRPDLGTYGYRYVENVGIGIGFSREEAEMDLRMKIAGDNYETVQLNFVGL